MVSMDAFASAFGFDAKSDDVWTALGKVTAVNGGTLSILLGGSATPMECEAYCDATVGDIVFVAISKGRARAIACKGGSPDPDPNALRELLGIKAYGGMTELTSAQTLTASAAKLSLKTFSGVGCSASSNGIKVENAGTYMVWGGVYMTTGYTVNDLVHVIVRQNSSTLIEGMGRPVVANTYTMLTTMPVIVTASAGDVFYLYAYNQTGARGVIGSSAATGLYIRQIA